MIAIIINHTKSMQTVSKRFIISLNRLTGGSALLSRKNHKKKMKRTPSIEIIGRTYQKWYCLNGKGILYNERHHRHAISDDHHSHDDMDKEVPISRVGISKIPISKRNRRWPS